MALQLARAFVVIAADDSLLRKQLAALPSSLGGILGGVTGSIRRSIGGVGAAGAGILAGLGVAGVVKGVADMEQAIIRAAAVFGAEARRGSDGFAALKKAAMDASEASSFSFEETAKALHSLGQGGLDLKNAIGALPEVIKIASIEGMDLARAAEIVVAQMKVWGATSAELPKMVDQMAKASLESAGSLNDFAVGLQYSAGYAKQANVTFAETIALLGAFRDAGVDASMAGTALRNSMRDIASPENKEASQILTRIGIDASAFAKGQVKFLEVLEKVQAAKLDLAEMSKLFGERGGPQLQAVFSSRDPMTGLTGMANVRDKLAKIAGPDTEGFASRTQAEMTNNFTDAVIRLTNAIKNLFNMAIGPVISGLAPLVDGVRNFISTFITGNPAIVAFVGTITGFMLAVGGTAAVIAVIATAVTLLGKAFAIAAVVIGPFVALFTGVVAMLSQVDSSLGERLMAAFGRIGEVLSRVFGDSLNMGATGLFSLAGAVEWLVERMVRCVEQLADFIVKNEDAIAAVTGLISAIFGFMSSVAVVAAVAVAWWGVELAITMVNTAIQMLNTIMLGVGLAASELGLNFHNAFTFMETSIKRIDLIFEMLGVSIAIVMSQAWDVVRNFTTNMVTAFESAWTAVVKGGQLFWEMLKSGEFNPALIAAEVQKAFAQGLGNIVGAGTESPLTKQLREDLQKLKDEFNKEEEANFHKRNLRAFRNDFFAPPKPNAPDAPKPPPAPIPVKFEFRGLADMWKKTQESITGGTMVDMTKQLVVQGEEQNKKLDEIKKKIGEKKDEAAPAAVAPG